MTEHEAPLAPHKPAPQEHDQDASPAPVGTLFVIALLVLATIGMWMLILGIQQGRA